MKGGIPHWCEAPLAVLALIALAPLGLFLALLVKGTSAGPVFFRQRRIGKGGAPFELCKFRTMSVTGQREPVEAQITAGGHPRVTAVGRWLRRTKLDELPELLNIARGEMSLVGPRPEVPRYVSIEDPLWRRVLVARPGLTDPATLELRNEEELLSRIGEDRTAFYRDRLLPYKLERSAEYLAARTLGTDIRVLFRTALAVFRRRNADQAEILKRVGEAYDRRVRESRAQS